MTTIERLRVVEGRTLHLVDLENLIGDPWAKGPGVGETLKRYLELASWREGDLVYVASCPPIIAEVAFTPPVSCSFFAARGEDGADMRLLAQAPPEWVVRRFGRLVIGSGDGIFAARAAAVRDLGVGIEIVSRRDALSPRLTALQVPVALLPCEEDGLVPTGVIPRVAA